MPHSYKPVVGHSGRGTDSGVCIRREELFLLSPHREMMSNWSEDVR